MYRIETRAASLLIRTLIQIYGIGTSTLYLNIVGEKSAAYISFLNFRKVLFKKRKNPSKWDNYIIPQRKKMFTKFQFTFSYLKFECILILWIIHTFFKFLNHTRRRFFFTPSFISFSLRFTYSFSSLELLC